MHWLGYVFLPSVRLLRNEYRQYNVTTLMLFFGTGSVGNAFILCLTGNISLDIVAWCLVGFCALYVMVMFITYASVLFVAYELWAYAVPSVPHIVYKWPDPDRQIMDCAWDHPLRRWGSTYYEYSDLINQVMAVLIGRGIPQSILCRLNTPFLCWLYNMFYSRDVLEIITDRAIDAVFDDTIDDLPVVEVSEDASSIFSDMDDDPSETDSLILSV